MFLLLGESGADKNTGDGAESRGAENATILVGSNARG